MMITIDDDYGDDNDNINFVLRVMPGKQINVDLPQDHLVKSTTHTDVKVVSKEMQLKISLCKIIYSKESVSMKQISQ